MELLIPAESFFASPHPAALDLPHLITALDAELLGKVVHLTKSKPGIWGVTAPFDENDVFDRARDSAPFAAWAFPANQAEILSFGPLMQEAVFGTKLMMLDSGFHEGTLVELATPTGQKLETGAYVIEGYQDLPTLGALIELCGWALIPIGPERSRALFITSPSRREWVAALKGWCERDGRNCGALRDVGGRLFIADAPAPAKYRENAIAHRIDRLLGEFEGYFGGSDGLGELVEQRVQARKKLQQDIARSKLGGSGGT